MAVQYEGKHIAEFLSSESNNTRSREVGKLATGNLVSGTVLGQVTDASGITAGGGNVGDGVAGAVTVGTEIQNGTYTLTCTAEAVDAGTFSVVAPNGASLPDLTVAVAYVGSHINLTIADGAEDFDVGDTFTIDAIRKEYGIFNAGASDGTQTAVAVLFNQVDASSSEQDCVVVKRDAEVKGHTLTWNSGTTEVQKSTAIVSLANVGIIVR